MKLSEFKLKQEKREKKAFKKFGNSLKEARQQEVYQQFYKGASLNKRKIDQCLIFE